MHNFHPIIITLNQNDKFFNEYFLLLEYLIDLMEIVDFFTKSILLSQFYFLSQILEMYFDTNK